MLRFKEDTSVVFFKTRERWGEFSNMHNDFPVTYNDLVWLSTEALYQALRFPNLPEIQEEIRLAPNAMAAKRKAYEYIEQTRSDWEEVKVDLMERVLRLKLDQYKSTFRILFGQTFERPIVEKSFGDDFWGARPDGSGWLNGANKLGLLWTLLRQEMIEGVFHANVELPLQMAA